MTKEQFIMLMKNQMTEKQHLELMKWIRSGDMNQDLDQWLDADLTHSLKTTGETNPDLEAISSQILEGATQTIPLPRKTDENLSAARKIYQAPESRIQPMMVARMAAAIIFIASFLFIYRFFTDAKTDKIPAIEVITKENPRGRKSTIFLKDGSVVHLNSASKVTYPAVFDTNVREIALEGEAYFEVSENKDAPFIVKTGNIQVQVLGTSFNIHAYDSDEFIKVALNSGKVSLTQVDSQSDETIQLTAGQTVTYDTNNQKFSQVSTYDNNQEFGWKSGKLVFKNADMETVFNQFERWYDVDIKVVNKPNFAWNYTGEFNNQTLNDVLESLSFSQNFEFDITKNKVTIIFTTN